MSIRQTTLQALAMAGVFALALFLAGCGGGGATAEAGPSEAEYAEMLQDAKDAASEAARNAREAAIDARTAANSVAELTGAGSTTAIAAGNAATAAENAATAAENAATAADGATIVSAAQMYQTNAKEAQETAESQRGIAEGYQETAQAAKDAQDERERISAVDNAREAVMMARDDAEVAKDAAVSAANAARTARDEAYASYMLAKRSRTDASTAKMQYDAAEMAVGTAEDAEENAIDAYEGTKDALSFIDGDSTIANAEQEQKNAEAALEDAVRAQEIAETQQDAAVEAARLAMEAASTHLLRIFRDANGQDITTASGDMTVDELRSAEIENFAEAMARSVENLRGGLPDDGDFGDGTATPTTIYPRATVTWAQNQNIQITVEANTEGPDEIDDLVSTDDNIDTSDVNEQNYRMIEGVGDFNGYEIWRGDDTDKAKAIVFTDKVESELTGRMTVQELVGERHIGPLVYSGSEVISGWGEIGKDSDGRLTVSDVTWFENENEMSRHEAYGLTGTLTCTSPASATTPCGVSVDPGSPATPTTPPVSPSLSLEGIWEIDGVREEQTVEIVTNPGMLQENSDYLAFGLWMYEASDDDRESFGAFASAGLSAWTSFSRLGEIKAVNPEASYSYSGKAFGAHHRDEVISWFDADVGLTLDFRDTDLGGLSGEVSNIRLNGGEPLGDTMVLETVEPAEPANGERMFASARMGDEGGGDYTYHGYWSATFHGDIDNAPKSIVGTFGVSNDDKTETFLGAYGTRIDD